MKPATVIKTGVNKIEPGHPGDSTKPMHNKHKKSKVKVRGGSPSLGKKGAAAKFKSKVFNRARKSYFGL